MCQDSIGKAMRQWKFSLLRFCFQFYFQFSTALSFSFLFLDDHHFLGNSVVTNSLQDTSQNDLNLALLRLPSKTLIYTFLSKATLGFVYIAIFSECKIFFNFFCWQLERPHNFWLSWQQQKIETQLQQQCEGGARNNIHSTYYCTIICIGIAKCYIFVHSYGNVQWVENRKFVRFLEKNGFFYFFH